MKLVEWTERFLGGDFTPLEHALVAVCLQALVFFFLLAFVDAASAWAAGTAFAIGIFAGREHAQAEELLCKTAPTRNHAVLQALMFWRWKWASQMDFYVPAVLCVGLWCVFHV